MTRRRDLILTFGAVALVMPLSSFAQPKAGRMVRIALLGVPTPSEYAPQVAAFRAGLRDLGYVEGTSVAIEFRWAENDFARLPELAAQLLRQQPDVLVTSGQGVAVAKRATSTVPIVMAAAGDVVERGLVMSLARPGGNVTGSSYFFRELNAKRLELLREALPRLARVGFLVQRDAAGNADLVRAMEESARVAHVQLQVVEVQRATEVPEALAMLTKGRADALVVPDYTMFVAEAPLIAEAARKLRMPAIGFTQFAASGGLLAYGVDFPELWRRAANFVDRIAKGAKPADLPIERPTRFETVINLKTARALGIAIPQSVRLRADRVIE